MTGPNEKQNKPSGGIPRGLLVAALLVVVFWGMAAAYSFLVPISLSALLAFLMSPLVNRLVRVKVPEWAAIAITVLLLLLPFFGLAYMLVYEIQSLITDFPNIMSSFTRSLETFSHSSLGERMHVADYLSVAALTQQLSQSLGQGFQMLLGGLKTLMSATSQIALVLLFAILMIASRGHLRRSAEHILARVEDIEGAVVLDAVTALIARFLYARLLIVVLIGGVSIAVLALFQNQYAVLLGFILGVLTLVPAVGFILSLIPIIIVSFATGHSLGATIALVGVLCAVSFVEGNILTPKYVGNSLNISALATFIGLFAGGLIWGVWGMLLSVPILGVTRIALSIVPDLQPWSELLAAREDEPVAEELKKTEEPPTTSGG